MRSPTAEYVRAARAKARADGKCGVCRARRPRAGLRTCDVCIARAKATKLRARESGRCRCGGALERNLKTCAKCLSRNAARRQELKVQAIQQGLCSTCCKRLARTNRSTCVECGAKHALRQRRHYASRVGKFADPRKETDVR